MVEDGAVTEGSSSTAFIVSRSACSSPGRSRRRCCPASPAPRCCGSPSERGSDGRGARCSRSTRPTRPQEAFYTSASAFVMPVVQIDGRPIGEGRPGPLDPAPAGAVHRGRPSRLSAARIGPSPPKRGLCRRRSQERIRAPAVPSRIRVSNRGGQSCPRSFCSPHSWCRCSRRLRAPQTSDTSLPPSNQTPPDRVRPSADAPPKDQSLSDKLQQNDGVIKPPESGTTGTVVKPDQSGSMPVIKPQELPGRAPGTEAK